MQQNAILEWAPFINMHSHTCFFPRTHTYTCISWLVINTGIWDSICVDVQISVFVGSWKLCDFNIYVLALYLLRAKGPCDFNACVWLFLCLQGSEGSVELHETTGSQHDPGVGEYQGSGCQDNRLVSLTTARSDFIKVCSKL